MVDEREELGRGRIPQLGGKRLAPGAAWEPYLHRWAAGEGEGDDAPALATVRAIVEEGDATPSPDLAAGAEMPVWRDVPTREPGGLSGIRYESGYARTGAWVDSAGRFRDYEVGYTNGFREGLKGCPCGGYGCGLDGLDGSLWMAADGSPSRGGAINPVGAQLERLDGEDGDLGAVGSIGNGQEPGSTPDGTEPVLGSVS